MEIIIAWAIEIKYYMQCRYYIIISIIDIIKQLTY